MHVTERKERSLRPCGGVDLVEAPYTISRLCLDDDEPAPPPGSPVILQGVASRFGVDVEAFRFPRTVSTGDEAKVIAVACPAMQQEWPAERIACDRLSATHFSWGWAVVRRGQERNLHKGPIAQVSHDRKIEMLVCDGGACDRGPSPNEAAN